MVDNKTCKNPKVVGIEEIIISRPECKVQSIVAADIADVELISDNIIAIKTMDGYIHLFSNCSYRISAKDCKFMTDRYFPD